MAFQSLAKLVLERRAILLSALTAVVSISGCGQSENPTDSRINSEFQKNYGMRFDVPLTCGGASADRAIDRVLENAQRLSDFCEAQNVRAGAAGYLRCPPGLCQNTPKPGGMSAPTLKFSINNGDSMSSMFGGFGGGSSGGSGSGSDSVFGKRIYVSMEFMIPLARNPDEITCNNPLSPQVTDTILLEIGKAALAAKNEPCTPSDNN
jgi:hypothetical protein